MYDKIRAISFGQVDESLYIVTEAMSAEVYLELMPEDERKECVRKEYFQSPMPTQDNVEEATKATEKQVRFSEIFHAGIDLPQGNNLRSVNECSLDGFNSGKDGERECEDTEVYLQTISAYMLDDCMKVPGDGQGQQNRGEHELMTEKNSEITDRDMNVNYNDEKEGGHNSGMRISGMTHATKFTNATPMLEKWPVPKEKDTPTSDPGRFLGFCLDAGAAQSVIRVEQLNAMNKIIRYKFKVL